MSQFKAGDKVIIREEKYLKFLPHNLSGREAFVTRVQSSDYLDIVILNYFPDGSKLFQVTSTQEIKLFSPFTYKYVI